MPTTNLADAANPLLLNPTTIARVTGGQWANVPDDLPFTGISFSQRLLAEGSSGDLFFVLEPGHPDASLAVAARRAARQALQAGAKALVVPNAVTDLPADWPLLRVEDPVLALDQLAFYVRDQLFTGKRVLVSGAQGCNDFKNLLQLALSTLAPCHALAPDVDQGYGIVASLASIREHDRVAVLQAGAQPVGRLAVRSGYVRPHLAVLTALGASNATGAEADGPGIEALAAVVDGLVDGAYCLVPADAPELPALRQAMLGRRRVPLVLFGTDALCPGRLLDQRFENNGWQISAEIEGQRVDYWLPLLDEQAPMQSVAVLLAAYFLGADVLRAAEQLAQFRPFDTRQIICPISCADGTADLYDQSATDSPAHWWTVLQIAQRLRPRQPLGRRVLVLGTPSVASRQGLPDLAAMAQAIDSAAPDMLVLVGAAMVALKDQLASKAQVVRVFGELGRRHTTDAPTLPLLETMRELVRADDLVLIAGAVSELGDYLRAQVAPTTLVRPKVTEATANVTTWVLPKASYVDRAGIRSLYLGSSVRQSIMRLDQPDALLWEFHRHMMGWLLFMDPESMPARHAMQLGLGAGSLSKACRKLLGMKTTAVELNPGVVEICREAFFMPPDSNGLQVIEDDAAHQIRLPLWQGAVDVLQVDMFDEVVDGPVFDDPEFFADCRAVLSRDGCMAMNIFGRRSSVVRTLGNMSHAFGKLALWSFARCSTGNTVVLAQRLPSRPSLKQLRLRAEEIQRRWGMSATEWVDLLESWVV